MSSPDPKHPEDRSAPEGSLCREHPETPAVATCPRCGDYACLVCWHPAVDRCDGCLKRDPTEAAPPIPWERSDISFAQRLFATIATARNPVRTAPAMARDDVMPALRFALLTFVPLALIVGVIPYTKTLLFSAPFKITLQGTPLPDQHTIVIDVLRASGIGFGASLLQWLVFATPYVSLVRAYGDPERRAAPLRAMLYRAFLLPLQQVIFYALAWVMLNEASTAPQAGFLMLLSLVPLVLLLSTMWSAARLGSGVGPVVSFVVVLIPVTLWQYVGPLVEQVLR